MVEHSMSSLALFKISCRKKTDVQTNIAKNPIPAYIVVVGNYKHCMSLCIDTQHTPQESAIRKKNSIKTIHRKMGCSLSGDILQYRLEESISHRGTRQVTQLFTYLLMHKLFSSCIRRYLVSRTCDWVMPALSSRKTWKFCEQFLPFLEKRSLSNWRYCADSAQNLPGPAPPPHLAHTVPDFIQIGYCQTREDRFLPHIVFPI